jgi:hypothetical protein
MTRGWTVAAGETNNPAVAFEKMNRRAAFVLGKAGASLTERAAAAARLAGIDHAGTTGLAAAALLPRALGWLEEVSGLRSVGPEQESVPEGGGAEAAGARAAAEAAGADALLLIASLAAADASARELALAGGALAMTLHIMRRDPGAAGAVAVAEAEGGYTMSKQSQAAGAGAGETSHWSAAASSAPKSQSLSGLEAVSESHVAPPPSSPPSPLSSPSAPHPRASASASAVCTASKRALRLIGGCTAKEASAVASFLRLCASIPPDHHCDLNIKGDSIFDDDPNIDRDVNVTCERYAEDVRIVAGMLANPAGQKKKESQYLISDSEAVDPRP